MYNIVEVFFMVNNIHFLSKELVMQNYSKIYLKLDPIIKEHPKMNWVELNRKYPEIGRKISNWSYNARQKKVLGLPCYGRKKTRKKTQQKIQQKTMTDEALLKIINQIKPGSSNKKEYLRVAKILYDNPNAIHSHLIKQKLVKICDANFYQFRKKFNEILGRKTDNAKSSVEGSKPVQRKKASLYSVLYEKPAKGFDGKSKELLEDFIETINRERLANLELVEVIRPNHVLEVRSFTK